jgi:hypothetical protein
MELTALPPPPGIWAATPAAAQALIVALQAQATEWNSLEIAKLFVAALTPVAVALVGYGISTRLRQTEEEHRRQYDDQKQARQLQLEEQKEQIERRHTPHIELRIDCQFFGPRQDHFMASFFLLATNRGNVKHEFPYIKFRLRGIKDEPFQYWQGHEPRAYFPHLICKAELLPPDWKFIYIEPGVAHQITFTTVIPADYSILLAHAEFEYKPNWPHTVEAVFGVPRAHLK